MQFMRQQPQTLRHAGNTLLQRVECYLQVTTDLAILRSHLIDIINNARQFLTDSVMQIARNSDALGFLTLDEARGKRSIQLLSSYAFENFVFQLLVERCEFRGPLRDAA